MASAAADDYFGSFIEEGILLAAEGRDYPYASGGVGPYYIDLRRAPSVPPVFQAIIGQYSKALEGLSVSRESNPLAFVGVPTTGVVYATALAMVSGSPLVVMEKLNPERFHLFSAAVLAQKVEVLLWATVGGGSSGLALDGVAFLGLEDAGVMAATVAGHGNNRPFAIMRRVEKEHGTSRTVEADLASWASKGITDVYIFNDTILPLPEEEVVATFRSVPGAAAFAKVQVLTLDLNPHRRPRLLLEGYDLVEVEDLWTTGTSALTLHKNIQKVLGREAAVLVFLDRLQGAGPKFTRLDITARAVTTIADIADYLLATGAMAESTHKEIEAYRAPFHMPAFLERLVAANDTSVCVGLDITPAKFPEVAADTTLPHFEDYTNDEAGVWAYTSDLMDNLERLAPKCRIFKPNLAYFNTIAAFGKDGAEPPLNSILDYIRGRVQAAGGLVILDAKIGDIGRTMGQYASKYKAFDAVTVNAYMGEDALNPVMDAPMGSFVLVFTSNPSRTDFETLKVIPPEAEKDFVDGGWSADRLIAVAVPMYQMVAKKVAEWNRAHGGSVGAVIGGTRNAEGNLEELEACVDIFMREMGGLPPLLIPGVGTQGGTAEEVVTAIVRALASFGLDEAGIRAEFRKVLINSSSGIDYAPRPAEAANLLADQVAAALTLAIGTHVTHVTEG